MMKIHNVKKVLINTFVVVGILVGIVAGFPNIKPVAASEAPKQTTPQTHTLAESETGLYIVQLKDPSVSMYMGGVSGLAATSPQATGTRRLDPATPASQAYLEYLNGQQQNLVSEMQMAFGHPIEVQFNYQFALNAVAVRISHAEALQAFDLAGVKTVYADKNYTLDTDMGPTLIGAPSIWAGDTIGDVATKGEGIVIGMIDSGINHLHPSFAEVAPYDGYVHINPYGDGVFHGWCATNDFCNNKLIGAYGLNPAGGNPEDTDGHGSHTSSTSGGNTHEATFTVGNDTFTRLISGVAPRANIVAYKVCNPSCPGSASIQAVNLAIGTDGVDVINYSISGGDIPWNDSVDQAFLDAFAAGIFVSASAGNAGPGEGTVAHTGPWNSSVAASTHSRIIANTLDIASVNGDLAGLPAVPGDVTVIGTDITGPILYAGDVDPNNINACVAFPSGSFTGKLGLAQRGGCTFAVKITNLFTAGATGAVIFNNAGGPPSTMGSVPTTIPSVMITLDDGLAVVDLISGDETATVTIYAATQVIINPVWNDIMAGFSSRGPSQYELLKPDYTAPGVNILAAVASSGGDPLQYGFYQGTSMSSPHSAGSAALMMALRPTWTIAEIRSAMNSSADPEVLDSDGLTPASLYAMGSGRLNLSGAGNIGLVMDETAANYEAANPGLGGDPKTLNQPSMVNFDCSGTCTWTRTLISVFPVQETWTAVTSGDPALVITVSPNEFTLATGASVELTITANTTTANPGDTLSGDVSLQATTASATHLPVLAIVGAAPSIVVDPLEITSVQSAQLVTQPLTITNEGSAGLDWELYDGLPSLNWSDNFDSYPTDFQLHGTGGWKGWGNLPGGGALTSDDQARSVPNSVAILGASDLVHEYSGFTAGVWTYTAWQYVPTDLTGLSYFILLNQYDDAGSTNNWSTQVSFDATQNIVLNEGAAGGELPLIKGQWVEIRVVIDLDANTQTFYYGNNILFSGSWTEGMSGGGILNIAAVDLFANNASVVYYDDLSLLPAGTTACGVFGDIPWLSTVPTSGTTPVGGSSPVSVLLDATGMPLGEYTAELCVASNDPATPLLSVPVTMTVVAETDLAITKLDNPDPVRVGEAITYTLTASNLGPGDATGVTVVDTLPAGVTFVSATAGCVETAGVVTCDVGALAMGDVFEITIVVTPEAEGTITNTATVTGAEIDPFADNNTATTDTLVTPAIFNIYLPLIMKG